MRFTQTMDASSERMLANIKNGIEKNAMPPNSDEEVSLGSVFTKTKSTATIRNDISEFQITMVRRLTPG